VLRPSVGRPPAWLARVRRRVRTDDARLALVLLVALCALISALSTEVGPDAVGPAYVLAPVLVGALMLRPEAERVLIAVAFASELADRLVLGNAAVRPSGWVLLAAISLIAERIAQTRSRLGVPGLRGESMLAELRDRLARQGALRALAPGWQAEVELRAAGGSSFGGDFLVSSVGADVVELALVDVSGKGIDAATRALLLSGALGGLLGAVPPRSFLVAANDYLIRQGWSEGFATAVHVHIDLASGAFTLDSAGHPPAATFRAGDGCWRLVEVEGPVIGLIGGACYPAVSGRLDHGDALLLYTDGVIEVPGRDLALGIDKLLGEANGLVVHGFTGGASRLVTATGSDGSDDCGVVLLWRH
jgi:hypothetical protein